MIFSGIRGISWSLLVGLFVLYGCFDTKIDEKDRTAPDEQSVALTVLSRDLNFPVSVDFIDNQDPTGVGDCSVLRPGMLLVADRGMVGDKANSIIAIHPDPATDSPAMFIFANQNYRDQRGESAVDAPTEVSFLGPFVWVSNVAKLLGSIAILDPNPCVAPNGPTGNAGEPIPGPTGTGIFGNDDFGFRVVTVYPHQNATDVGTSTAIKVKFSQAVDPTTITKDTFKVEVEDTEIDDLEDPHGSFTFWEENTVVEFVYQQFCELGERTKYRITLDTDILDLAGNELDGDPDSYGADDFVSYFTTTTYGNPRVTSVDPYDGATNVSLRPKITVWFSKRMTKPSESAFKVVKDGGSSSVGSGSIYPSENGEYCYYILFTANLEEDTKYWVIVTPDAEDMAGTPLDQDPGGDLDMFQSWFSTGAGGATGFCLQSMNPANESGGVAVSSVISAVFNKPVNTATLAGNFAVSGNLGSISGAFEASGDGSTITFRPDSPLTQCNRVTVTIGAGLLASDGEQFSGWCSAPGNPAISVFDTVCENPYVASNIPVCDLQNVLIDTVITVNFSELMDLGSINPNTFYVYENDQQVSQERSVIYTGDSTDGYSWAQFRLLNESGQVTNLRPESHYTVWVSIYARDLNGNSLDQNRDLRDGLTPFTCHFTTGSGESSFPPCVVSTVPAQGATGVSILSVISVCFSNPMNRSSVTSDSFVVIGSAGPIPGTLTVSADGRCIDFQADPALPALDTITISINSALTDEQGRSVDADCDGFSDEAYYFTFTTSEGAIVINEVVTSPKANWNDDPGTGDGVPFNEVPGSGSPDSTDDEWVEIYNGTGGTVNFLTEQWKLVILDSDPKDIILGAATDAVEYYSGGSSADNFMPNTYLVVGNPATAMNQSVYVRLVNPSGETVDDVELGSENYKGDGNGDNAPYGSASSASEEAVARCPNGFDSDYNADDFIKTSATIAASNNSACISSTGIGAEPQLPYMETGIGGIVCAGAAPDDHNEFNLLSFAFSCNFMQLYAVDLDDGIYPILTELENVTDLCWIADSDGVPGHGQLFLTRIEDTLTIMNIRPSGQVGAAGTRVSIDPQNNRPTTSIVSPYFNQPVGVAYSTYSNSLFVANRGDGTVTECTLKGKILHVYNTGLGPDTISDIDIGDTLGGETVILTLTGGKGIDEFSGTRGSIVAFQPLH